MTDMRDAHHWHLEASSATMNPEEIVAFTREDTVEVHEKFRADRPNAIITVLPCYNEGFNCVECTWYVFARHDCDCGMNAREVS
jgi:aspartate carbamoyltransferase regulatory subunit